METQQTTVILKEIFPNHRSTGEIYLYDGKVLNKIPETEDKVKIDGWMFAVHDIKKGQLNPKVYLIKDNIFLDIDKVTYEITDGFLYSVKKYPFIKRFEIFDPENRKEVFYFYVNPLKYLENDGSFPDDVEPFTALMLELARSNNKAQDVIAKLKD